MDLYQQNILEHYKKPLHKGEVQGGAKGQAVNPLCGDRLEVSVRMEGDRVADFVWQGEGCVLSLAAADMLSDELIGKSVEQVKNANSETVIELIGTVPSPSRLKCALLVLEALKDALSDK
jgi:nitrogen fixation protein NifU and related proteins